MPDLEGAYLVFDVESVGLHGEGFAVGWAGVSSTGRMMADGIAVAPMPEENKWVADNVLAALPVPTHPDCRAIRETFWEVWMKWRELGARLAADVPWPVEARFLIACVDDQPRSREWHGPYPLIDIASVRLAAGQDPLAPENRQPLEEPPHNPLADARQSARLLIEALYA